MNREEAIHRLKNTAWLGTNKDREETEQAVDMAIEALSANDGLRCALAGGRKCFAQGYDFTWCITCPHISEEDRQLVNHAVLALPSADAEPKWNCTANFVAEQLDRLRNMTDEERWNFLIRLFSPSAEVVRCKDCRWWKGSQETKHNNHLCKRALDQDVEYWTKADDYCSYGERREP